MPHRTLACTLAALLMLVTGCTFSTGPQAHIVAGAHSGYPPWRVTFDGLSSTPGTLPIVAWQWDFGDGTSSDESVATHTYEKKGSYAVLLTVFDEEGRTSRDELVIHVLNRAPHAQFTYSPYQPPIDHPVRFDATPSLDEDGEILSYAWDFGDGTTAVGPLVEHVFPEQRVFYPVVLTVTDDDGAANSTLEFIQAIGCETCG